MNASTLRSDPYHKPLPDPVPYLQRLGYDPEEISALLSEAALRKGRAPSGEDRLLLDDLILRHQTHIPFENLDICLAHRPVSLDPDALYEKIVLNRRGGYCFELNGLFVQLLEELGFRVRSILCRVVRGQTEVRPCLHRAILAELPEGLHFCDVGFGGPMPPASVPLSENSLLRASGETFRTYQADPADSGWWVLARSHEGGREEILEFTTFAQSRAEFLPANAYCSSPGSYFASGPIVNLRTENGHRSLTGNQLTVREGSQITQRPLHGEQNLIQTLEALFGITWKPETAELQSP